LFELLGGEFAKKYGCDPRKNLRCRLRLLDSIEKMRKLLTSNKDSDVNCESLMEDEDLRRHFSRDELEELIMPFVVEFKKCLEDSLEKSSKYKY
jgi:heat shock protein 4